MRSFRLLALTSVAVATIAGGGPVLAQSQQPGSAQRPVFRSGVDLVTIDVTVVDRDGKPVSGLKPEDFSVSLDGEKRAVRALDYLEFGGVANAARPVNTAAAGEPSRSQGGRVILIVVDDLSVRPGQMTGLRVSAQRMLASLDLGDLVGVATTSGLGPAVSPTRDRAAVTAALSSKDMVGRYTDDTTAVYVSIPEAFEIDRNVAHSFAPDPGYGNEVQTKYAQVVRRECYDMVSDAKAPKGSNQTCMSLVIQASKVLAAAAVERAAMQMSAYAQFVKALSAAPSPRIVVALSAGIALGADRGSSAELDQVGLAAARAGVQFYALTEVGDTTSPTDAIPLRAAARRDEEQFLNSGVQTVATAAGGSAFKVVGQADRFFSRIVSETSGVYRLAVETPPLPAAHDFVAVKVSVNRSGVDVRTKANALSPSAAAAPVSITDSLESRLAQGGAASGVPLAMTTTRRRDPGSDRVQVGIHVQVPGEVSGPLFGLFGIVDQSGKMIMSGRKEWAAPEPGADYRAAIPVVLADGQYRVRFIASDARGNIGAVEQPVAVTLPAKGSFATSDLLVSTADPDGAAHVLTRAQLPASMKSLHVALEVYRNTPSASMDDLTIRFSMAKNGDSIAPVETNLTPVQSNGVWTVSTDIDAGALTPGTYTLKATLLEAGVITGTTTTTISKAGS